MRYFLALSLCLAVASPAWADVSTVSGGDEMTDTTYSGILITSSDVQAYVWFICDSPPNSLQPRIMFQHGEFLTSSGNAFSLSYRIDKEEIQHHYFKARPNHRSGTFFVKYEFTYEKRFGKAPRRDYKEDRFEYLKIINSWKEKIHMQFVTDFAKGNNAIVRVWDYNEKSYTYKFDLSGIVRNISAINECYSGAKVDPPSAPPPQPRGQRAAPRSPAEPQTYVARTRIQVYRKPTTRSRTGEFFVETESFKVTEVLDGGRWLKVVTRSGKSGYVFGPLAYKKGH